LDRWVLEHLGRGKGHELTPLYDLESDSIHGGVAELRLWLAVAGACEAAGAKAVVTDYITAYSAAAGVGFAYWPVPGAAPAQAGRANGANAARAKAAAPAKPTAARATASRAKQPAASAKRAAAAKQAPARGRRAAR
jgi:hypothetical protein